ncbi:MAG: DPP IV N-terminal domain-containing protein [Bacteroidales bacterium]|nr:DPP IV N-terminal domain-containing protein [Bacteroidales bacterium]
MKRILPILVLFLSLSAAAQPQQAPRKVTKANYGLAARFSQKRVGQMVYTTKITPNWFANDDRFWYSYKTAQGTKYYLVDPASGRKSEIFDMDRLAMQITEITRDPYDARHLPLRLELKDDKYFQFDITSKTEKKDTSAKAKDKGPKFVTYRFYYDIATKKLTWDTDEHDKPYPTWANVSPDGTKGVYVKNHNLYLMDSTSLRKAAKDEKDSTLVEIALTTDGTAEFSWNGNNYSGDNETDSTKRAFAPVSWAPDSKKFATLKWDMSMVKPFWVINSVTEPRPTLETYHYQMPGEPGPIPYLYVMDTEGKAKQVKVIAFKDQDCGILDAPRTAKDEYKEFRGGKWMGDNDHFWLVRQSRDLKRLDLCRVDVGSDSTKTVLSERMNTYVEYRSPRFLKDGRFVWWSERNGWANLYLYGADGTLQRNLTDGPYHVEDVLAVGDGYVLASACGVDKAENPYQMHTFRVPLTGGPMQQLDMADMDVSADASDDAKYFVANYSRVDCKPASALFTAQGRRTDLEEADFSELFAAGYKFPERFVVKAADGITDLYGAIYKPFDFDSTKVYALADYVYPGPQVEANNVSWSSGMTRIDRLAQLGMIVITVGNRGGHPNRSKWYHNYGYGNLRDYGLEDQKYAIQQLAARHPYIDLDRVGIHGHSGGGFMSTAAILQYNDFFKAAVSCAGNHDNRIYNRWWSEQHHGIAEKIENGDTTFVYKIETNPQLASRLKGHLMLVHGDTDNNVNPANSIRVANALIRANKRFEYVIMPGQRHGFGDMNEWFFWKMADHYSRWLIGDPEPRPIDIEEMNND